MLVTMGRAIVLVAMALGLSYAIWLKRDDWSTSRGVLPVYVAAVFVQCVHLTEEVWTGFYRVFPVVMGGAPWSERQFMIFNFLWLGLFFAVALGIRQQMRPAYVGSLFLAIGGGILNGLGHVVLALRAGGYFPGAYTAPLVLVAGYVLLRRHRPTVSRHRESNAESSIA
jgi:hypothetical protein